jgi:hypothetical protein
MRRALHLCILAVLVTCERPGRTSTGIPLAGTWDIEITRGSWPWARTTVRGQVHLASAPLPKCDQEEERRTRNGLLCHTLAEGTWSIPLDSLTRPHPYAGWTPDAGAIALTDGTILVEIGGCCDRGEFSGRGRVDRDRIKGRWHQQFLNNGPGGRFVMRRAPVRGP